MPNISQGPLKYIAYWRADQVVFSRKLNTVPVTSYSACLAQMDRDERLYIVFDNKIGVTVCMLIESEEEFNTTIATNSRSIWGIYAINRGYASHE